MKNIVALFLFVAASAAGAQALDRPLLLVASPEMKGLYSHTALLVVPTPEGQHAGFILNRATEVKLAALFPDHPPSAKVADPVYFGGPQMVDSLFAVVRRDPGESSLRLLDGLFVTSTAEAVDRVIEQTPNDARYFAGFVGWKPGELAREIAAGYWYVGDAGPALVFSHDTDAMWEKLVERFGNGHAPQKRMIRAGL
jgi:putative transcriptional regulator